MPRQLRVFLCHASQDKPAVRELYKRLKAEDWIDPWLDEEKLSFGQHWATAIEDALDTADIVLIFISQNSVQKEGFIQRELNYAWELSLEKPREVIFLIPFRLDNCEVPRFLRSRQWGDYFGEKKDVTYQILLRSLKQRYQQKLNNEAVGIISHKEIERVNENTRDMEERGKVEQKIAQERMHLKPQNDRDDESKINAGKLDLDNSIDTSKKDKAENKGKKTSLILASKPVNEKNKLFSTIDYYPWVVGILVLILFFILWKYVVTFVSPTVQDVALSTPTVGASQVTGLTPLSSFLNATYTPTPLYVSTPRSAAAVDQFRIAKDAYDKGDWDTFINSMLLLKDIEPDAADIPYYIGEAYRFKGDIDNAITYYNSSIQLDSNFSPPYLGLARVRLISNADFDAANLFEQAIELDPNYGEAYLEHARWLIDRGNYADSFGDLELAEGLLPGSPEVYLTYAYAYLGEGNKEKALEFAQKANSADVLNLPTYKLLGDLYIEREDYENAAEVLRLYTSYKPEEATDFGKLGLAYYYLGEYQNAIIAIDNGLDLDRNGMKKYLVYRGLSNIELSNFIGAEEDLSAVVEEDPESFEARLGYAKALYGLEKFGSAFLQAESMRVLADTDEERALELYWRALIQEKRNDTRDAIKSWQDLLKLEEEVMTSEMRQEAQDHLKTLVPPMTNTP